MDLINSRKHSCERNKWICLKKKKGKKDTQCYTNESMCRNTFSKDLFRGSKYKIKKKGKKKIGQRAKIKHSMG